MADSGTVRPTRIQVRKESGDVVIDWMGGRQSRVGLRFLRQRCPCAVCSGQREQHSAEEGLHLLTATELRTTDVVRDVVPVGRYAIQIRWRDGHDAGIYTYDYLWRLADEADQAKEA